MTKTNLIYTTYIKSTSKKTWAAITNPEFSRQYWGGMVNISDWKVGSKWEHQDTNDDNAIKLVGEVIESIPYERLVLSWSAPDNVENASTLTFNISTIDDVVCLNVSHSDLITDSTMHSGVSKGWPLVLSNLKTYLEGGDPMDMMSILGHKCGED